MFPPIVDYIMICVGLGGALLLLGLRINLVLQERKGPERLQDELPPREEPLVFDLDCSQVPGGNKSA